MKPQYLFLILCLFFCSSSSAQINLEMTPNPVATSSSILPGEFKTIGGFAVVKNDEKGLFKTVRLYKKVNP